MNWIALASVITSALVALGTVAANFFTARGQRSHEATLAYEARAWERKSDALFEVIRSGRALLDSLQTANATEQERLYESILRAKPHLDDVFPVVEAYASADCRARLHEVREHLRSCRVDIVAENRVASARRAKEEAIEARDFEAAADARDQERRALREMTDALGIDKPALARALEELLDAARESVRGR